MNPSFSNKWIERFLDMAEHVSAWSKDPSTKVGAVIASEDKRIVSVGFNGFPSGVSDIEVPRERKYLRVIHAEDNAILFSRRDLRGCSIFVTHPPCANCAGKIIQSGIVEVYAPLPSEDFLSRWGENFEEAKMMFNESDVSFFTVTR